MNITGAQLWVVGAWVIAIAGCVLLGWAIWWDWFCQQRKGRARRCPKCWYDMEQIAAGEAGALRCPECGRVVHGERRLLKSQRRWGWAVVALVLLACGWLAARVPAVQSRGWWAMVPRPALIGMFPAIPPRAKVLSRVAAPQWSLSDEFYVRVFDASGELRWLSPPERWLLAARARSTIERRDTSDATRAMAARAIVRLDGDAHTTVTGSGRGHVLIAKMERTYAGLRSFRCTGTVFGNIGVRDERPFVIAMERPDRFRFEFLSGHPFETKFSMRYVVWQDKGPVNSWWTIQPQVQSDKLLSMALAGPTGVSGGSAYVVPSMLMPNAIGGGFSGLTNVSVVQDGDADGQPCYRVRGSTFMGSPETLWIDKATFMLLRHDNFQNMTTVYAPEPNATIDPAWFAFDPEHEERSPLQDMGRQTRPPKAGD